MSAANPSRSMTCANCGASAQVVISISDQGLARVVTCTEGKFYVSVVCPFCGKVTQEVGGLTANSVPHTRV
jgi:hypothetical protein